MNKENLENILQNLKISKECKDFAREINYLIRESYDGKNDILNLIFSGSTSYDSLVSYLDSKINQIHDFYTNLAKKINDGNYIEKRSETSRRYREMNQELDRIKTLISKKPDIE